MLFIFSTSVLIRHLLQLKTVVFLNWCLIHTFLLITIVKSFMTQAPVANVIKHFTAAICEFSKLARVFVPGKHFQSSIMFAVKAGSLHE